MEISSGDAKHIRALENSQVAIRVTGKHPDTEYDGN